MTQTEHRLVKLAEECNEVAQRCTKAIRFGMSEIQQGKNQSNRERIRGEMGGLVAAYNELIKHDFIRWPNDMQIETSRVKQEHYRQYSEHMGTLQPMAKKKKKRKGRGY